LFAEAVRRELRRAILCPPGRKTRIWRLCGRTRLITGMKQLYYDLAGDPMPEAMDMLLKITDERHLLYGSDFPYVPAKALLGKKAALDNELANRQWLAKIYCQNSQELIFS